MIHTGVVIVALLIRLTFLGVCTFPVRVYDLQVKTLPSVIHTEWRVNPHELYFVRTVKFFRAQRAAT